MNQTMKTFYELYPDAKKLDYSFIPENVRYIFFNTQIIGMKKAIENIKEFVEMKMNLPATENYIIKPKFLFKDHINCFYCNRDNGKYPCPIIDEFRLDKKKNLNNQFIFLMFYYYQKKIYYMFNDEGEVIRLTQIEQEPSLILPLTYCEIYSYPLEKDFIEYQISTMKNNITFYEPEGPLDMFKKINIKFNQNK